MKTFNSSTAALVGSIAALYSVTNASAAVSVWQAQDLVTGANGNTIFANGATVTTWVSNDGRSLTNTTDLGTGDPLLNISGGYGGRAAVNFSADALGGAASDNPVVGFNQFTIAFSFRATAAGRGTEQQWWQNSGIVDAEQPNAVNDWGTVINGSGQLGLGTGGPDVTGYTPISTGYADSQLHAAVLRYNGVTGDYDIFVDNGAVDLSAANKVDLDPRNSFGLVFGRVTTEPGMFTGDLAEVRIFTGPDSLGLDPTAVIQLLQVPEPSTILTLASGLGILALRRRRLAN